LRLNPHSVLQQPINYAYVSFAQVPELLASVLAHESTDATTSSESLAEPMTSPYTRRFIIDFSTTAKDLMTTITHFLRGEGNEVSV